MYSQPSKDKLTTFEDGQFYVSPLPIQRIEMFIEHDMPKRPRSSGAQCVGSVGFRSAGWFRSRFDALTHVTIRLRTGGHKTAGNLTHF